MGVLTVQINELEMLLSEQARCSQYYFGQSVETCGFFPKGGSFGCLLVQKFRKTSRIYHGWICYIIYFHFRVRLRLGVAWDWRSAKLVTSPFVFFQSFVCHPYESYDVFSLWLLDLEFSLTIQMQKCLFVERLRTHRIT